MERDHGFQRYSRTDMRLPTSVNDIRYIASESVSIRVIRGLADVSAPLISRFISVVGLALAGD